MSRYRKLFVNGTCIEVCFRTEEGLPLIASAYMLSILRGIIARASELYPVITCHAVFLSNHAHLILVVEDPECIKNFVGYIKRESAHAINHLLGRKKHTIWCDGYDSFVILDVQKAIERIVYLYTNPQNAGLVERIEDYPNFCTWNYFISGGGELRAKRIPRDTIEQLPNRTLSLKEQEEFASDLEATATEECVAFIAPDAWMQCFAESRGVEPEVLNEEIIKRVRQKEDELSQERERPVVGAHALRLQRIDQFYEPKKRGMRMICVSSCMELRKRYIKWFHEYCDKARKTYSRWKAGDWLAVLPPGLFAPGGILRANIMSSEVPLH